MPIMVYTQTVVEHPDMGNFVSVMIAILIATSIWEEPVKWFVSVVSCCGEKLFAWGSKRIRRDRVELLHSCFLREVEKFVARTSKLFKIYHLLAFVSAAAGIAILYFSLVQYVGRYNIWLALPIGLYMLVCIMLAICAWGIQAIQLLCHIIHAIVEGKQVKNEPKEKQEIKEIIGKTHADGGDAEQQESEQQVASVAEKLS